jgi:hypothetical protein
MGCGFGCKFTGAGLILNPMPFFIVGMKILYMCLQTREPAMDI